MTGLPQSAQAYFRRRFGIEPETLVSPIDPQRPAGASVRGNGVYSEIKEARRQDDPTLPLGPWAHELKRADWSRVGEVALDALATKTKDLQLAAWLLESQINLTGFDGIGACIALMRTLCERFWQDLHPAMEDGDLEYRTNVVRWVDEKLLPAVRLVPVTAVGRGAREYRWADWEQAKRNEQLRSAQPEIALEGCTLQELSQAMAGTPTDAHLAAHGMLQEALEGIDAFNRTLDDLCGADAPSLNALGALLEQIRLVVASELHKRGVQLASASAGDAAEGGGKPGAAGGSAGGAGGPGGGESGPIRDRADAYARLAQAADYLAHIEPHSPAPYLVQRAIQWGNLNTAELYHELFVKFGGQLSIFELLGLKADEPPKP